jgi:hypothetical protein
MKSYGPPGAGITMKSYARDNQQVVDNQEVVCTVDQRKRRLVPIEQQVVSQEVHSVMESQALTSRWEEGR